MSTHCYSYKLYLKYNLPCSRFTSLFAFRFKMGDSIRSMSSQFSTSSRRTSAMSDISESDIRRLEELREIGKKAKNEARGMDVESLTSGMSTMSKGKRRFRV